MCFQLPEIEISAARKYHFARRNRSAVLILLLSMLCLGYFETYAQGVTSSHWGASLFPDIDEGVKLRSHVFAFTEFGKELNDEGNFEFVPYNDISETLGFNVISVTTTSKRQFKTGLPTELIVNRSIFGGVVDDFLPRFLQNNVAHFNRLWLDNPLQPVPRKMSDRPVREGEQERVSLGPTKGLPIIGFSYDYTLPISFSKRVKGVPEPRRQTSPIFVGGGYMFSSVNNEFYLKAGVNWAYVRLNWLRTRNASFAVDRVLGGVVVRAGIPFNVPYELMGSWAKVHMDDLYPSFVDLQGGFGLRFFAFHFPFTIKYILTQSTGYFVEKRNAEELALAEQFAKINCEREGCDWSSLLQVDKNEYIRDEARSNNQTKRPKRELYSNWILEIGAFRFEYFNDSVAGKDKGPSFGISIGGNFDF